MPTLRSLRGQPMFAIPLLGRRLTLYRQGAQLGLLCALATFGLFNMPWHVMGEEGEGIRVVLMAVGAYYSAALIGSWTALDVDADSACSRWL